MMILNILLKLKTATQTFPERMVKMLKKILF